MNRAKLLDLLARAEKQIALGTEQINNQYRIIAKLKSGGHDTTEVVDLLKQIYEVRDRIEQERDLLVSKLEAAS